MAHQNRGPEIEGVTILFLVLCWIVVVLRFYVRLAIVKKLFLDDWLTAVCLLFFTAYGVYGIIGVHWGAGQHMVDIPPQNISGSLRVWYVCEVLYAITCTLIRVTAGVFLLRFARLKSQRYIIFACQIINVIYNDAYLASIVFQCIPISYFWARFDGGNREGSCFDFNLGVRMTLGNTIVAAVTDWTLGLLPIWIMWNVKINNSKKTAVCVMLGLGIFASAAPLIRIPHIYGLLNNTDFLWATTDVAIWSVIELGIGIITISLHSLRPLAKNIPFFTRLASAGSGTPSESKSIQMPIKR